MVPGKICLYAVAATPFIIGFVFEGLDSNIPFFTLMSDCLNYLTVHQGIVQDFFYGVSGAALIASDHLDSKKDLEGSLDYKMLMEGKNENY